MVKHGYKQTEIGVIPEDWDVDTIKSITFSVATGGNYKNSTQISPYPLIKMGNISRGNINVSKIEYVTDTIPSEKDRLIYGDVLFNTRNTPELVGKVAIWKNELPIAYLNSNLLRFNFNLEKSNPFFMNLIFNTEQVISEFKNIAKGTTSVAAIYPQDMLKVLIKIPPLPEQERIAEALSDVDDMISSLEKLIAKKKAIKQGTMQELLTGKKRLHGFTGEWKPIQLGSVSKIKTGDKNNEQKTDDGKYPFFVRSQQVERINSYSYDGEAILIPGEGNIGQIFHYINGKFDWHQRVYKISDFSEFVCGKYVYYQMKFSFGEHALKNTVKATVDSLRLPTFEQFEFLIPPIVEEQNAIASVLSDMDNEIETLEQKLEKTRQIKQGMMQQLLTGKIRLV